MKYLVCVPLLLLSLYLNGQDYLQVAPQQYGLDTARQLMVVRLSAEQLAKPWTGLQVNRTLLRFTADERRRTDVTYPATYPNGDTLTVAFTRLPLVKIGTQTDLNEYEHKLAGMSYMDDEDTFNAIVGLRHRGSFSLRYPKKSLDLEFWNNSRERQPMPMRFGDMREDDDWVLDALYNEPLRVTSIVAHELWLDLHAPYYGEREEEARSGADGLFVEVFFRGGYAGLFLLTEQVDRKQLQLDKDGGELYKAIDYTDATLLRGRPGLKLGKHNDYAGWEMKHPEVEDSSSYAGLFEAVDFVANASDREFGEAVGAYFHLPNLIDYFLYLNVATLTDNAGKNSYLARYEDGEPYFYVPWDLDASFGNRYNGEREAGTRYWITNGLQDRLLRLNARGYADQLCARYEALRRTLIAADTLIGRLERKIDYLKENGVYAREALRWPGTVNVSDDQLAFTRAYTRSRLEYLDGQVCSFAEAVSTQLPPAAPPLIAFPNPVGERLHVSRGDAEVADYQLSDLSGRRVAGGQLRGRESEVPVALPAGVYLLRVVGYAPLRIVVR